MIRVIAYSVSGKIKSVFRIRNFFTAERIDFFKVFFTYFICVYSERTHRIFGIRRFKFTVFLTQKLFHSFCKINW